jgi:hypothetical protein
MKTTKRAVLLTSLVLVLLIAAMTSGLLTAEPGAPPQQATEAPPASTEEPLPEFQPTERLPADSAVAFPTDI